MSKISYPGFDSLTPLQRHGAFFDRNQDGEITISETSEGLQALGVPWLLAGPMAATIHLGLAQSVNGSVTKTQIAVKDMQKGKHDSDTDIYTKSGDFDQKRFDELFLKHDKNGSGSLSVKEVTEMRRSVKETTAGNIAAQLEWTVLMSLAADTTETDENGCSVNALSYGALRSFYEGRYFFDLEQALKAKR